MENIKAEKSINKQIYNQYGVIIKNSYPNKSSTNQNPSAALTNETGLDKQKLKQFMESFSAVKTDIENKKNEFY